MEEENLFEYEGVSYSEAALREAYPETFDEYVNQGVLTKVGGEEPVEVEDVKEESFYEYDGESYPESSLRDLYTDSFDDYVEQGVLTKVDGLGKPIAVEDSATARDMDLESEDGLSGSQEEDTFLERTFGKNEVTDWFGDMYRAKEQGFLQAESVDPSIKLMTAGAEASVLDVYKYVQKNKEIAEKSMESDEMKDFNRVYDDNGGGAFGFLMGVIESPSILPSLFISSMATQIGSLQSEEVAAAGVIGAGSGAALGLAGGVFAPITSSTGAMVGGLSAVAATMEAGLTFSELLEEQIEGEITPEKVRAILEDPEKLSDLRIKSIGRGVAVGAVEGLSGGLAKGATGLASRAISKGKSIAGRTARKSLVPLAGGAVEVVGGMTGEVAGRLAAGQEMDVKEIGFEGFAGLGSAPISVLPTAIKNINIVSGRANAAKVSKKGGYNNVSSVFDPNTAIDETTMELAVNKNTSNIVDEQVEIEVANGRMTQEESESIKENFRATQGAVNTANKIDRLSKENKPEVVNLLIEEEKLKNKIKDVDNVSLTKTEAVRLKEVQVRLEEISNPKEEAVSEIETEEETGVPPTPEEPSSVETAPAEETIPQEALEELEAEVQSREEQGSLLDNVNKEEKVYLNGKEGNIKIDPTNENTIIFESSDEIIELGNKDEVGSESLSGFGLTTMPPEGLDVQTKTADSDVVSIDGKEYNVIGRSRDKKGKAVIKVKEVVRTTDKKTGEPVIKSGLQRRIVGAKAERVLKDVQLRKEKKETPLPLKTEGKEVTTPTKKERRAERVAEKKKAREEHDKKSLEELSQIDEESQKSVQEFEEMVLEEAAQESKNKDLVQVGEDIFQVTKNDDGSFAVSQMNESGKLIGTREEGKRSKAIGVFKSKKSNQERRALAKAEKLIDEFKKEEAQKIDDAINESLSARQQKSDGSKPAFNERISAPESIVTKSLQVLRNSYAAGNSLVQSIEYALSFIEEQGFSANEFYFKKFVLDTLKAPKPKETTKATPKTKAAPTETTKATGKESLIGKYGKVRIRRQVAKAKKALSKIAKGVTIEVYETQDEFEAATNGDSVSGGIYEPLTKTIKINLEKANPRTVAHEVFHALLLKDGITNARAQKVTSDMMAAVRKVASPKLLKQLDAFADQYKNEGLKSEESIAELFGILAESYDSSPQSVKDLINDWIRKLAKALNVPVEGILDSDKQVLEFLGVVSGKVARGEVIEESDIGVIKGGEFVENPAKTLTRRQVGGFEVNYTEKDNIDTYIKDGRVTEPKNLKFLDGLLTVITSPDDMLAGEIKYKGEVIFEGEGGVFFVTKFGDVWASGKEGTANNIANALNNQLKENNGRAFLALTKGTDSKLVSSASGVNSTLAVLNTMVDNNIISIDVFKSAVSKAILNEENILAEKKKKDIAKAKKEGKELTEPKTEPETNTKKIALPESISELLGSSKKYFTDPKTTTFETRGNVVKGIVSEIAKSFKTKESKKVLAKFLGGDTSRGVGVGNTTLKSGKPGSQALVDLIAKVAAEDLTKGLNVGDVYAVIEINSEVIVKEDSHPSYPFHISLKNGKKPVLHLIKNRENGRDVFKPQYGIDEKTGEKLNNPYKVGNVSVMTGQFETVSDTQTRQQKAQDDFTIQDVIEDAEQEGLTRKETIEVLQELGFTKDEIRGGVKPVKEKARSVASETTGLSTREAFKQGFTEFFDAIQRGKKEARVKAAENLKEKVNKVRESFKKRLQKEKDNKDARAAVVKDIRAIIKDSGISQFSKRTINKIMTNVKNANVNNMQRMFDEVMDVVNRDIDRNVKDARYKTLKAARKKLSRLGALKELQKPLMEMLSINPDYLSKAALNFYDKVVVNLANVEKKFDNRASREDLKKAADEVIKAFTADSIAAEELAGKTINPNLDLTKTKGENLKQMLKDRLISDSDFELMTRFEDLIGNTEEELTLEKLEQKAKERRDAAIEDFEAAMDEIPASLPNLSRDDKEAVRFANGLKMKDLESLSTAQIKKLTRGVEMLQAGYVTTELVQSKVRVEANRDTTETLISETEERGKLDKAISKAKVFVTNLFRKRNKKITSIENRIKSTPLTNIDQILNAGAKKFKSTRIYESIFRPVGAAFSKTEDFLKQVKKKLQVAETYLDLNGNKRYVQKAKVMIYQIQREYESNPGNNEVGKAIEWIKATLDDPESNISDVEREAIEKIRDEFTVNGQIDSKKILDSLTSKEKKYMAIIDEGYKSVEFMVAADAKMQGKLFVLRENYVHLPRVTKSKNSMSDDLKEISSSFTNPALKNKALTQRDGTAHAISFDPTFNVNAITKKAAISYYMYPAVKKAKITLGGVKKNAQTDFQKETADALESVFDGIVKSQYAHLSADKAFIEKALAFLGRAGYLAQLAGPIKAVVELSTNLTHALFVNPTGLISGFDTLKINSREIMNKAIDYLPTNQNNRLSGKGVKDSKEVDSRLINDSLNVLEQEEMTSEFRAKVNTIFKFAKKPASAIIKFNENLISRPDTIVARPLFVGVFNKSFENIAQEKPNWEKIANDESYRDKFRDAIKQATEDGDTAVVDNAASNNPFDGIPKNVLDKDATPVKQALQMVDRYMTRFRTFEYYSALKGIQGLMGKGKLTPTQGAMLLAGTVARLSLYKMGIDMVFTLIFSMLGIDKEEDEIDLEKDLTKGVLGAVATLALGRSFGNIAQMPINYGTEWLNKEYGEDITRSGEYNQYKDGLVFSKIPMEVKPQDNMVEKIVTSSLGSYTPMVKTLTRGGKVATKAATLKTEESRDRNFGELTTRIPFEIAGNLGVIPGYKSLRKIYLKYLYGGIENSATSKQNKISRFTGPKINNSKDKVKSRFTGPKINK